MAAASAAKSFGKLKWGDVEGEEDVQNEVVLTSKPDAKGISTIVEYYTNEDGQRVKVTRRVKISSKTVRVSKRVMERRQWKKFGDCATAGGIESSVTYTSPEVFHLDLRPKKREDEQKQEDSAVDKLPEGGWAKCRNCGEAGHFTLKCPKRRELGPGGPASGSKSSASSDSTGIDRDDESSVGGKYVPVHLRQRAGVSMIRDEHTLRVTNLSEDSTEQDLQELFRRFGHTTRIYLAKDRQTGRSRGFAFVNYASRSEAQAAIDKLNGHGYDNLILHVEWAKPREDKGGEGEDDERQARSDKPYRGGDVRRDHRGGGGGASGSGARF